MIPLSILAGALAATTVLLLLARQREHRRPDPNLTELIALIDRLCQRVQAPQTAVLEHHELGQPVTPEYAPPAVHPDDDEAYWESREQMAERLMRAEVNGGD